MDTAARVESSVTGVTEARNGRERRVDRAFEKFKENLSVEMRRSITRGLETHHVRYVDAGTLAGRNTIAATNAFLESAFGIDPALSNAEKEAIIKKTSPHKVLKSISRDIIFARTLRYCLDKKYNVELRGGFNHYGWFNGLSLHIVLPKDK